MAASFETIKQIIEVLERRLDPETIALIACDLLEVDGNKSFRDTIQNLHRRASARLDGRVR